ncbi:MAG: PA14 domain-containing protein [Armatimonadota bacterium]|nr:PA14 domain-containing protein [Armatimonadota bacterium]
MRKLYAILTVVLMLSSAANYCSAADLAIRTLKVLAVIYRGAPRETQRLDDAALKGTCNGIELGRLFYFRNTRCKLNLDITYMVVDAPAPYNAGPTYDYIVKDLEARGIRKGQYDGVFCTGVGFLGNFGGFQIMGRTGACFGGTDPRGNFSWYPEDKPDVWYGTAWTFVHEFQHALDSPICTKSGHPEMLHAHPYADSMESYFTWGHRGGMHWDWIAHTLSSFQDYLDVPGVTDTVTTTVDADNDGMPDEDPRLPMDEKRFGSDPSKVDSDGDGLSDLDEFCADIYRGSDPTEKDTDGDGIWDGIDKSPTVAIAETVAYTKTNPQIDGRMESCYRPFVSRAYAGNSDELKKATIYACWNEDALFFFVRSSKSCTLDILIDTSAENGFWEGGDTYPIRVAPDGKVTFFELGLSGDVPGAKAAWGDDGLEVMIPALIGQGVSNEINWGGKRRPEDVTDGMVLLADRRISVNLILSAGKEKSLFTPNWSMFDTTLVKYPSDPPRPSLRFTPRRTTQVQPTVVVTGVLGTDRVVIVDSKGNKLGERLGNGPVVLTGKVRVGSDASTGSNVLKAVCRGAESDPVTLIVDTTAQPPRVIKTKGGSVSITGEPEAKVDVFTGTQLSPVWPVLTVQLDSQGRGSFTLPENPKGFVGAYGLGTAFDKPLFWRLDNEIKFDYDGDTCDPRLPSEGFCIRWTGYLDVPREGDYTFYLSTDDGSRLWIDNQLIVDNWGHHALQERVGTIRLTRGEHEIRVDYYEDYGWAAAHLEWSGPGIARTHSLPVKPWPSAEKHVSFFARQTDALGNTSIFRNF